MAQFIGFRHTLTSTFSSFLLCPRSSLAIVYFDVDLEQTSSLLTALVLSRIQNEDHVILLPSACFLGFILRVNILLVLRLKVLIIHKKFQSFFCSIKLIEYLPVVTCEGNSYPHDTFKNRVKKKIG